MGCCGSGASAQPANAIRQRQTGSPIVTGYAVDMPDGRALTYLSRDEAEGVRTQFAVSTPVREILGWR